MGFNLNRSEKNDYKLKERQIKEMISIYGVVVDYMYTEKMNVDAILKDFSHLTMKKGDSIKIDLLPEDTAGWEGDLQWDMFGLHNQRTISFFIAKDTVDEISERYENKYSGIINSLIVLPSGTILEITDMVSQVEGVNNLFTYSDNIAVYRLNTKVYYNSKQNVIDAKNITTAGIDVPNGVEIDYRDPEVDSEQSFDDLDDYFNSLEDVKEERDIESQKVSNSDSVFGSLA